ncbi:hypothetical protein D3C78_1321140 [compost metagenome]
MQVTNFNILRTNKCFGRLTISSAFKAFHLRSIFNQCRLPDKSCHKWCFRLLINIPRRTLLFQLPLVDDHNLVRDFNRFVLVMRYEDGSDANTLNQLT